MEEPEFNTEWQEIVYLCDRTQYFIHEMLQRDKAKQFVDRMRTIMPSIGHTGECILGETALALIAEYDGEWGKALTHRKNELRLISSLHESVTEEQAKDKNLVKFILGGRERGEMITKFEFIGQTYRKHAPPQYKRMTRHIEKFILPFS